MPNDFALVGSAIVARLGTVQYSYTNNSGSATTGSVNIYNTLAPQATATPYIVFQMMVDSDEYTFNTRGLVMDYMVKAVSNRTYPSAQAYPIYAGAHDALQDAPLSVSGYTVLRCRRINRIDYRDQDGYWHSGGVYRIDMQD